MLVYALAIAVALGSFTLFMAAFFFPEVHRRNDFIWSGVGLFYALVLWLSAERITGGVLLGQAASITLLGWLGWQTLTLRRAKAPTEAKTEVSDATVTQTKNKLLGGITGLFRKQKPQPASSAKPESVAELVEEETATETATPESPEATVETPETPIPAPPEVETPETPEEIEPTTASVSEDDSNWPDDDDDFSNWPDEEEAETPEISVETPPNPEIEETATPPEPPTPTAQAEAETVSEAPEIDIEKVAPEAELSPPVEDPASHDAPPPTEPINREEPPKE